MLVDFYTDWCGPCQAQAPTLGRIAASFNEQAKVAKVNVVRSPELARHFDVRSIPILSSFQAARSCGASAA
ncbi:MAG: hypothetical protein CTY36_00995 [Methylocystis sp.]|nr:MAG: hypothetical protein CTY36_00995 [Methylocystis sp.]